MAIMKTHLNVEVESFEDLQKKNDRYEFIYPNIEYSKEFE